MNEEYIDAPIILGSYNDWEFPTKMMRIEQYTHRIDKQKPEFVKSLKEKSLVARDSKTYLKMKEPDKKVWKTHVFKYINEYMPENWKKIIPKVLKYRDPNFINAFDYQMHLTGEIFVAAFFAKPGSHDYVIADYREGLPRTVYTNSFKT